MDLRGSGERDACNELLDEGHIRALPIVKLLKAKGAVQVVPCPGSMVKTERQKAILDSNFRAPKEVIAEGNIAVRRANFNINHTVPKDSSDQEIVTGAVAAALDSSARDNSAVASFHGRQKGDPIAQKRTTNIALSARLSEVTITRERCRESVAYRAR
jgi:hypothetical protein